MVEDVDYWITVLCQLYSLSVGLVVGGLVSFDKVLANALNQKLS